MIQMFLFDGAEKRCFKCGEAQPRTAFYRHPQMADGLLGKCIACTKQDALEHRERHHDACLAYDRQRANQRDRVSRRKAYARTIRGAASHAKAVAKQRVINPEKYKARTALSNAVRDGLVTKGTCMVCGCTKVEGHHHDYSKPLHVEWLCKQHHTERHRNN